MIDRRFEAIENDENQELSKMLACAEQHLTCLLYTSPSPRDCS